MKLISGNSHPHLATSISDKLNAKVVSCDISRFSNTEIRVRINESIRNEDIFIIQTGGFDEGNSVNDYIMETLEIIDACRRSNVKSITLILPCYPYARQDKKDEPRVPISAKLMANMYRVAGVDRLVSVDLHASQIQGFVDYAFDNLYTDKLMCDYIRENIFNGDSIEEIQDKYILVSPDNGGAKRIMSYSQRLILNNVIMHKQRDYSQTSKVMNTILVGKHNLQGKTAIIVDDMCDTMGTMVKATDTLVKHGVDSVIIVAVHGIFSGPALERINECEKISQVIVTDTLSQEDNMKKCGKIEAVGISTLLSGVIKNIMDGGSISQLFN